MPILIHIYYTGTDGGARAFAAEMEQAGIAAAIRQEPGNLRYDYFLPLADPETVLLIDAWRDQEALNAHHASPMMDQITALREKYGLRMSVERCLLEDIPAGDRRFIRD